MELDTPEKTKQRLDPLHENPVRSGWFGNYKYSSAVDYYTNEQGVITIPHL